MNKMNKEACGAIKKDLDVLFNKHLKDHPTELCAELLCAALNANTSLVMGVAIASGGDVKASLEEFKQVVSSNIMSRADCHRAKKAAVLMALMVASQPTARFDA